MSSAAEKDWNELLTREEFSNLPEKTKRGLIKYPSYKKYTSPDGEYPRRLLFVDANGVPHGKEMRNGRSYEVCGKDSVEVKEFNERHKAHVGDHVHAKEFLSDSDWLFLTTV